MGDGGLGVKGRGIPCASLPLLHSLGHLSLFSNVDVAECQGISITADQ